MISFGGLLVQTDHVSQTRSALNDSHDVRKFGCWNKQIAIMRNLLSVPRSIFSQAGGIFAPKGQCRSIWAFGVVEKMSLGNGNGRMEFHLLRRRSEDTTEWTFAQESVGRIPSKAGCRIDITFELAPPPRGTAWTSSKLLYDFQRHHWPTSLHFSRWTVPLIVLSTFYVNSYWRVRSIGKACRPFYKN